MAIDVGSAAGLVVMAAGIGLFVRFARATWKQDRTGGVDTEWLLSGRPWVRRMQQRMQIPLAALAISGFFVFLVMLLFPGEKADTGVGGWATVVVVLLLFLNFIVIATTALFGRPKLVIAPAFRDSGGLVQDAWRWLRNRP